MGLARPTFERRQLGVSLRRLREHAGRTQQEAADQLGKVRSRVIALEDGTSTASEADLVALLDWYGVEGAEREVALELGALARQRAKRRQQLDSLPDSYHRFADLERSASEIDGYESGVIPELLQCAAYVRALLAEGAGVWWREDSAEAADRLAFRLTRQEEVFGSPMPRTLRFVIGEEALRATVGGPEVRREQAGHLLTLLDRRPELTVRVLPADASGNPLRGGNLLVFRFDERGDPVGFSSNAFGPAAVEDPAQVTAMILVFRRVWGLALGRSASRELIADLI